MRNASRSTSARCLAWGVAALCLGFAPARAGEITVSYGLGGGAAEPGTGFISHVTGVVTVRLHASRATPSATSGFVSGGTVLSLNLSGGPTHGAPNGATQWTIAGSLVPASPFVLAFTGTFTGVTSSGKTFAPSGGFRFAPLTPYTSMAINATLGNANGLSGTNTRPGKFYVRGDRLLRGAACFDVGAGFGPCFSGAVSGKNLFQSNSATAPTPAGFATNGSEVARVIAIEPLPEPGPVAALALGILGLAGVARLRQR